jgi:hypothetical protein
MSGASRAVCAVVIAITWLGAEGCGHPRTCDAGPFQHQWSGPAAYTASASSAPSGLAGSALVAVSAANVKCTEPDDSTNESLTFTLSRTCVLTGRRTSDNTVRHCTQTGRTTTCTTEFIDGTAEVGELDGVSLPCELPLGSGTVRLLVEQGTAHVTAKGAFDITLGGTLVHWDTVDELGGYVTIHFESAAPAVML